MERRGGGREAERQRGGRGGRNVTVTSGREREGERGGWGGGAAGREGYIWQTHMGSPRRCMGLPGVETSSDESTSRLLHQLSANFKGLLDHQFKTRYIISVFSRELLNTHCRTRH